MVPEEHLVAVMKQRTKQIDLVVACDPDIQVASALASRIWELGHSCGLDGAVLPSGHLPGATIPTPTFVETAGGDWLLDSHDSDSGLQNAILTAILTVAQKRYLNWMDPLAPEWRRFLDWRESST